jgi:hypothetical protein
MLIQVESRNKTDQPQDIEMDLGGFYQFRIVCLVRQVLEHRDQVGCEMVCNDLVLPLLQPSKMMGDLHKYVEEQEN